MSVPPLPHPQMTHLYRGLKLYYTGSYTVIYTWERKAGTDIKWNKCSESKGTAFCSIEFSLGLKQA